MAPLLEDPRFRQRWNHISHNAETATESAAAGIWAFTHTYINPCFEYTASSFDQCTSSCFPDREERARRQRERGRGRGRAEYSFDFYDDWDENEDDGGGLIGWGNDELDRLLAGSGVYNNRNPDQQPSGRKKGMSYGTRKNNRAKRKTADGLHDPTIIPSTNSLGFLGRLPFKFGHTLRYKPSAADLQEHPGAHRGGVDGEGEPFLDEEEHLEEGEMPSQRKHGHARKRSSTVNSGETTDSFRSRGDLFPSDGEDDAVPLGDEFDMVLERRMTGLSTDGSSGKTRGSKGKRIAGSRAVSRTISRTTHSSDHSKSSPIRRTTSTSEANETQATALDLVETPSLTDLNYEEELIQREEEAEIEKKRFAAAELAIQRGLSGNAESRQKEPAGDPEELRSKDPDEIVTDVVAAIAADESSSPPPDPVSHSGDEFVPARLPHF